MSTDQKEGSARVESLAVIVSHPLRRRIWYAITEHPISPRELADQLRVPVTDIAYHVRRLRDLGVIESAGTRPVRGVTQHFYRLLRRAHLSDDEVEALGPQKSMENGMQVLQCQFADAAASLEARKLVARREHFLFRFPVALDEEGWQEFSAILGETADRLYEAEARCVDRRRESGEESEPVPVVVHLNLFERG